MAKITATFERYFQHKPYEGEKIILTVEDEAKGDPVEAVAALHAKLADIGDEVTARRMRAPDPRNSPLPDEEVPF